MASPNSQKSTIVSVLRIHRRQQYPSAVADEQVGRLVEAVQRASSWSQVIVAYDAADTILSRTISARPELNPGSGEDVVTLLPVQPWSFTVPLNATIIRACALRASKIVFISLEMMVSADQLAQILSLWSKKTLVIGKTLDPHGFQGIPNANDIHRSEVGISVKLTGLTSPWNTFAIWDLPKLAKTGFLALSDTNVQPGQSAIEEVPTIALHQRLFPGESEAILVKLEDHNESASGWDTNWNDPQRTAWQQSKLATKDLSAASHLRLLGLHAELQAGGSTEPHVLHLDLSRPK